MSERKRRAKPGEAKDKIFEAALTLFEARGFDAVAVPEIAAEAGVAVGSIYRHAASKDALVNSLFQDLKSKFNARVFAPTPADADTEAQFRIYWRRLSAWVLEEPVAARFLDLHYHAPYLDAKSLALEAAWLRAAQSFAEIGVREGALRPMTGDLLAALIWGPIAGLLKYSPDGRVDPDLLAAAEPRVWAAISA